MQHTISVLAKNRPGVLGEIGDRFKAYALNIKSISAAETHDPQRSCLTIAVEGHDKEVAKVAAELRKMPQVVRILDLAREDNIACELVLVKVRASGAQIARVCQIAELFTASVADVGRKTITLQLASTEDRIGGLLRMLKPFGIRGLSRTGKIALRRGDHS